MTTRDTQVKTLMKNLKKHNQQVAALKSGMDVKTARKYIKSKKAPSEMQKVRVSKGDSDRFAADWPLISKMLENSPGLQAKTVLAYLMREKPTTYHPGQLRTLQRQIKQWRVEFGEPKAVIFSQIIQPGRQSQSDCTWMNTLNITIGRQPFKHLLFHFMLPYSRWESITLCYTENFENLVAGYEKAVWELGYVARDHRTDNLTAATQDMGSHRAFTERWQSFMAHYEVSPSTNNLGVSHENGSVEKSHDTLKTAIEQELLIRGYRDFDTRQSYEIFLEAIVAGRNHYRQERLQEEIPYLQELPLKKWHSPVVLQVRVSTGSVVQILEMPYSVPSRLIHHTLKAYVYPDEIILFYGKKLIQQMPRVYPGQTPSIDYRHIIDSLVRKPAAFAHYQYRESLFPSLCFRQAYDLLQHKTHICANKSYLHLLQLAKIHSEQRVAEALELLLESNEIPSPSIVKELIDVYHEERRHVFVAEPDLSEYDKLLSYKPEGNHAEVLA
jgi:hypothetical protein